MARGVVELRGWVPTRAARAIAGRTALAAPGHRERDQQPPGARRGRFPRRRGLAGHRPERMTEPLAPQYNPSAIESALYAWWQERGLFAPDAGPGGAAGDALRDHDAAAERHGGAAHGARAQQHRAGRAGAVRADARAPGALAPGHRPRRHRHAERGGAPAGQGGTDPVRRRPRGVRRAGLGLRARDRRRHPRAAQGHRLLGRLVAAPTSRWTTDSRAPCARRSSRCTSRGSIYRGHYIINWCPRCLTALSNEEAEKEEMDGKIWHLALSARRRQRARHRGHDPARDDAGRHRRSRCIPRTSATGTWSAASSGCRWWTAASRSWPTTRWTPPSARGAVKVTPAHDPADFEIGRRHELPVIDVMTPEARISLAAPERFQGLDRFEARDAGGGRVRGSGPAGEGRAPPPRRGALLPLRHGGRAAAVGPVVRAAWRRSPRPRSQAYRDGTLRFIPERRGDDYAQWLEGIRDWCISRQLWWGHRIPVWYCESRALRPHRP